MTVIELFSSSPIDNMISCLTVNPDKVVFVGDGRKMRNRVKSYAAIAERLGMKTVFEFRSVTQSNLSKICEVLIEIVEAEEECCFDLTGGSELALVAIGRVYQMYVGKRNLQMQRYNVSTGKIIDCDGDGNIVAACSPIALTCKESIALHGGKVTQSVDYVKDTDKDSLDVLWAICKKHPSHWNTCTGALNELIAAAGSCNDMHVELDKNRVIALRLSDKLRLTRELLKLLSDNGAAENIDDTSERLSFDYANATAKKCVSKAGNLLEAKAHHLAYAIETNDGIPLFNDCLSGVMIDWDGENEEANDSTVNEIDLVLMRGYVPIFVSCKNGAVDSDELYKLSSVAEMFGGKYAKKVLIVTKLDKDNRATAYLLQRAEDMGIRVIANVGKMRDDEFAASLAKV